MAVHFVKFRGRRSKAIGSSSVWRVSLKAENNAAAVLALYDTHEDIGVLDITTTPSDPSDYINQEKYKEWDSYAKAA